ncbi:hypothetical protein [Acetobacter orientalis]|uniref:hypothetical protein n=1 Tax=Acetobacter orientalis TaxID=146474 RepID=UPI0039EAC4E0
MLEQPALFTLQDVFALLNVGIAQAGGNNAFARKHGVHKTTVSNWANTNRHVSDALLDILDLERVTLYRPKKALQNGQGAHNG